MVHIRVSNAAWEGTPAYAACWAPYPVQEGRAKVFRACAFTHMIVRICVSQSYMSCTGVNQQIRDAQYVNYGLQARVTRTRKMEVRTPNIHLVNFFTNQLPENPPEIVMTVFKMWSINKYIIVTNMNYKPVDRKPERIVDPLCTRTTVLKHTVQVLDQYGSSKDVLIWRSLALLNGCKNGTEKYKT